MDKATAQRLVRNTLKAPFDRKRYYSLVNELCNGFDESKAHNMTVPDAFAAHVKSCQRLGTFTSPDDELADVLVVQLTESWKLERSRTALRDFVAHKLKRGESIDNAYKEAGLIAFVAPDSQSWRFSYVRMDYETQRDPETGKIKTEERLTPARRYSYLVGAEEECHTAQTRFLPLLQNTAGKPTLAQLEEAFSVESVTREFFNEYARLFKATDEALTAVRADLAAKGVSTVDFAKKLLGQIVFLYFIQKKGWLGVSQGQAWGEGPRHFLRQLADQAVAKEQCLFNAVLEPLFYDTLATDRGAEAWCPRFKCRIPFLNGGLFEPLAGYDWEQRAIALPNALFTNRQLTPSGDIGTGILDVFDRYNFTVNEAEPLEKEVAIDPEMLGKVFENLIEENRRKGLGAFYTPREIVHYMCQESLINYLDTMVNQSGKRVERADIEALIREGEQAAHYEAARKDGTVSYQRRLPKAIEEQARVLDEVLSSITVCDPAIGSGAFPVGMMTEIVRARMSLTPYLAVRSPRPLAGEGPGVRVEDSLSERTAYHFKRHAIQNSLYGVDIDGGAVEIAKLRLWLSLVVDEEDVQQIKPLPNLDYKVVAGNSLLGVEKNLFNEEYFKQLEVLKPKFFNESDRAKKAQFKQQIDHLIHQLTKGLEVFDFEIYFSEVFHRKGGFDVVIANPPYGADIDKMLPELRPIYFEAIRNYAEIYKMFMQLGMRKVRRDGIQTLITPNTFLAQPRYKDIRSVLLQFEIVKIVNLGEGVFENVVVPTCLSFIVRHLPSNAYVFADLSKESKFLGDFRTILFRQISLDRVKSSKDLSLYFGKELRDGQILFADALEIKDAGIQYHRSGIGLKNKGGNDLYERLFSSDRQAFKASKPVWYGRLMDKWFIAPKTDEYFNLDYDDILKSNESATFSESAFNVTPKILWRQTASCLRATIDTECRWFRNTIQCAYIKGAYTTKLDVHYVLGVINSRFIAYTYNSLVKEAGRVFPQVKLMHVKKLPMAIVDKDEQKQIADLVKKILAAKAQDAKADTSRLEREIDQLVYALYGLTRDEIAVIEAEQ